MSSSIKSDRSAPLVLAFLVVTIIVVSVLGLIARHEAEHQNHCYIKVGVQANAVKEGDLLCPDDHIFFGDGYAQWIMTVFAGLATATGVVGIIWIRQTLEATRDTAKAAVDANKTAREIGQAQVRAYVGVIKVERIVDQEKRQVFISASIQNSGQTPARQITYRANVVHVDATGRRVIAWGSRTYDEPADLTPGAPQPIFNGTIDLSEEQFSLLQRGALALYFEGYISYETVFHRRSAGWVPSTHFQFDVRWIDWKRTTSLVFNRTKQDNHAN